MASRTPHTCTPVSRPRTPARLRILELRTSIEQQLTAQIEQFAGPAPPQPYAPGSCRMRMTLSYGRGKEFEFTVARWTTFCVAHSKAQCTRVQMISPQLSGWKLEVVRNLWIEYTLTGKKWGKQDVPAHLIPPVSPPQDTIPATSRPPTPRPGPSLQPRIPAAPRTALQLTRSTPSKRKRSPTPPPSLRIRPDIIDLTGPELKKRRIVIDLEEIDLTEC
ncbi:hypothetical protein MVEN_00044800 [Mycena venus]|uniref:Uncharacterized protein n=1 Tax=Mycena venus TaxID=2733690 RepID=A0A8H7DHS8_9AGAR|nr:hypothetical protein MVEN_00044800 [Mycena venus]